LAIALNLVLGYLYPELMNIYADRGNVECLQRRSEWRGIGVEVRAIGAGTIFATEEIDILLIGGGQDRQQAVASEDMQGKTGDCIRRAVEAGTVLLGVCGGYQLIGHSYVTSDGRALRGMGLLDVESMHPGDGVKRCIGNIAIDWGGETIVGFENHGGRSYLGPKARPLGKVLAGMGNNANDRSEGAVQDRVLGTYMHGSLLPKNPHFADHLLGMATHRHDSGYKLAPLEDLEEWKAHESALSLMKLHGQVPKKVD
jgi:hypothetical protein